MADEEPDPESPATDGVADDRAKTTEAAEMDSSAWRVLLGIPRGKEHDLRVTELFSRASVVDLHLRLNELKNRKYELLRQFSDLERLRDVHPRRGALNKLERRIRLFEEAIRSKERRTEAVEQSGTSSKADTVTAPKEAQHQQRAADGTMVSKNKETEVVINDVSLLIPNPTSVTPAPQTARRRAGRKPNAGYNAQVAEVLRDFPDWRDHSHDACEALDKRGVGLPPGSKKAREDGWTTWMDALDKDPEWLRKALQHRAAIR